MPKTDPRPLCISAVGTVKYTVPASQSGATITSIEGGTVARYGSDLTPEAVLNTEDVLTFTPTSAGGTTTLNVVFANQEFSGKYSELDGAPAPSSGGTATLGNQGSGEIMLTAQGATTDTSVSKITFHFLAESSRPVLLQQIWMPGYIAGNSAGDPPLMYVVDVYGNTLIETIPSIAEGTIALNLVTPRRIQPGEELLVNFPVAATIPISTDTAPVEGIQMYYATAGASGVKKGNMTAIFSAAQYVSIPGALNPDAMPLYRVPFSGAGGSFEIIDPPGGTPYLRYVAYDGKEYRWPGTLLT